MRISLSFKILIVSWFLLAGLASQALAVDYDPVLFLRSENTSVLVGNQVWLDLYINSLGNQIKTVDAQIAISGAINSQALTYNMHPSHPSRLYVGTGLQLESYQPSIQSAAEVVVNLKFSAKDESGFNEGSTAIPLYQFGMKAQDFSQITATITSVRMTSNNGQVFEDMPGSVNRPYNISVLGGNPNLPTPQPIPASPYPSIQPTPNLVASPTPNSELDTLKKEVDSLTQRVDTQEAEISWIKKILNRFLGFFRNNKPE